MNALDERARGGAGLDGSVRALHEAGEGTPHVREVSREETGGDGGDASARTDVEKVPRLSGDDLDARGAMPVVSSKGKQRTRKGVGSRRAEVSGMRAADLHGDALQAMPETAGADADDRDRAGGLSGSGGDGCAMDGGAVLVHGGASGAPIRSGSDGGDRGVESLFSGSTEGVHVGSERESGSDQLRVGVRERGRADVRTGRSEDVDGGHRGAIASGNGWTLHRGFWQAVLAMLSVDPSWIADALIFDAPYSQETHEGSAKGTRDDGSDASGLAPSYGWLTPEDVHMFVQAWSPRCRGWMVSITDDVLAPVWKAAYKAVDRVTFPIVPAILKGMTHRMHGDGPDNNTLCVMVSRPRGREWIGSGTRSPFYIGGCGGDASGGRGKPEWLLRALVEDYSKPGDLVVDPFAGWGSTLRAAAGMNRRGLGIEMDLEAFNTAVANLRRPNQVDMFAGLAG